MLQHTSHEMYEADIFSGTFTTTAPADEPDLFIQHGGRFHSRGHFRWENLQNQWVLHFVQSGRGQMIANGAAYTVAAGDIFTFAPGVHVVYYDYPETPWHYSWLAFCGRQVAQLMNRVGISAATPLLKGRFNSALQLLLTDIVLTFSHPEVGHFYPTVAAWQLLNQLAKKETAQTARPDLAVRARHLVDTAYMSFIGVEELADKLKISRATLFRHFRQAYGISPKTYIDTRRLERARGLVLRSSSDITDIANACGYSNVAYFIRAFRQRFGMSPGLFRQQ